MSTTEQVQQEIQYELIIANQLLQQISAELQIIKQFTSMGGEFEANIKENASLISTLAKLQNLDLKNIPPLRKHIENQTLNEDHILEDETTNLTLNEDYILEDETTNLTLDEDHILEDETTMDESE